MPNRDSLVTSLVSEALNVLVDSGAPAEVIDAFARNYPEKIVGVLLQTNPQGEAERDLKKALAVRLFEDRTMSMEAAAKLAGLPQEAFMQLLGEMAIPAIRYAAEELDEEVKAFSK